MFSFSSLLNVMIIFTAVVAAGRGFSSHRLQSRCVLFIVSSSAVCVHRCLARGVSSCGVCLPPSGPVLPSLHLQPRVLARGAGAARGPGICAAAGGGQPQHHFLGGSDQRGSSHLRSDCPLACQDFYSLVVNI